MNNSDNQTPSGRSWHYILLWLIALASLGLNIFLVIGLNNFRREAEQQMNRFAAIPEALGALEMSETVTLENFELPVKIDEIIPISLDVPFSDTFEVPIKTTIPISTSISVQETISVPINDTVSLNRDARIFISVLGQSIPVDIPIRADIPLNMQTNIPIDIDVPVQLDIPIDLIVEVPIQTSVPIDAEIPVKLEFPVTIPLEDMGLTTLLTQVQDGLRLLSDAMGE